MYIFKIIEINEITHFQWAIVYVFQPYTFGAILNRDEVFENIVIHGINLNLPWAVEHKQNTDAGNENDGSSVDQPSGSRESSVEKDQFSPDSQNLFL